MHAIYVLPIVLLLAPLGALADVGPPVEDCPNKTQQLFDMLCGLCKKLCDEFSVIPKDASKLLLRDSDVPMSEFFAKRTTKRDHK